MLLYCVHCCSPKLRLSQRAALQPSENAQRWSVCLLDFFSEAVGLHVEMKVPAASPQHRADILNFVWLPVAVIFCARCMFRRQTSKALNGSNRLNTAWNTTQCRAESFFLGLLSTNTGGFQDLAIS